MSYYLVKDLPTEEQEPFLRKYIKSGKKISWMSISTISSLSVNFIREYNEKFLWSLLSANKALTPELVVQFENKVDFREYSRYNTNLSMYILDKYTNQLNWKYLSSNKGLTIEMIRKYQGKINFQSFNHIHISLDLYDEFKQYLTISREKIKNRIFNQNILKLEPGRNKKETYKDIVLTKEDMKYIKQAMKDFNMREETLIGLRKHKKYTDAKYG